MHAPFSLPQYEYFNTLPVGIIILKPDFSIISWNQTLSEWTGIPQSEVIGRDIRERFPRLSDRRYVLRIQQVMEGGPAAFFSTQFHPHFIEAHLPDGGLRFQRTSVHPLREDGEDYALIFIDDVTDLVSQVHAYREMKDRALYEIEERKRKEAALEESEKKFREIFDSANDAIHLHEIRDDGLPGRYIDVNVVATRMLGYSKEELLTMTPLDLVTGYHSRPLAELAVELQTLGQAVFETEHRRKDGSIVPVEIHAHVVFIRGRKVVLSIIRDITRRKHDEATLRKLSTDLKTIIDSAPAMIWYKDTRNNIIRVNPAGARTAGRSISEIEGKSASELFPDLADQYYQDDRDVLSTGVPKLGIIEQMRTSQGGTLWVQTDKLPLYDERGELTGLLIFSVDITERKMAEDALALASRKINLLSSITRHDILNQVTILHGYMDFSRRYVQDPEKLLTYFEREERAIKNIEQQISFTRDYQDMGVRSPVWHNITRSIERSKAALPVGEVQILVERTDFEVFADPLFEKVFYNLIDNALRYGGPGMKNIRVSTGEREEGLVVTLEDDGAGIPAETRQHLFTRGYGKNTGLGLFLCREILLLTDITIRETSEAGSGARFELLVPKGKWRPAERKNTC